MLSSVIKVTIANEHQWRLFAPKNEMIALGTPRKLFPTLEYKVEGLSPDDFYSFDVRMDRTDDRRYEFTNGRWKAVGEGLPQRIHENVQHIYGYQTGAKWMQHTFSFGNLKVTNKEKSANLNPSTILLESHHHYVPILIIKKLDIALIEAVVVSQICFEITAFYACRKFNDPKIKLLKQCYTTRRITPKMDFPSPPTSPAVSLQESECNDQYQHEYQYSPSNSQPNQNSFYRASPSLNNFRDFCPSQQNQLSSDQTSLDTAPSSSYT